MTRCTYSDTARNAATIQVAEIILIRNSTGYEAKSRQVSRLKGISLFCKELKTKTKADQQTK